MVAVAINIPEGVDAEEAKVLLAIKLLEMHRISLAKAAEVAGYSRNAFIEILSKYKVAAIDYPAEDLRKEFDL